MLLSVTQFMSHNRHRSNAICTCYHWRHTNNMLTGVIVVTHFLRCALQTYIQTSMTHDLSIGDY